MGTLLFGTGGSALNLLKNLPEHHDYLAAVDNDKSKHGMVFQGLQIISPSEISHYEYDKIMIACYWEGTIKKQLIEELGIAPEKVITPHKKYFKNAGENLHPFQHPPTLALAHKIILILCGSAHAAQVPLHVDYGTLLGIMRDDDLISWDDDIDLAGDVVDAEKIENLLLDRIGGIDEGVIWDIQKSVDVSGRILEFSISFVPKPGIDYKQFPISVAMKGVDDGMAIKLRSFGAWSTPAFHTATLDTLCWKDTDIFIPSDCDGYLRFTYGNWHTPKKDLSVGEGENWKTVPVEKITQAHVTNHSIYSTDSLPKH